MPNRAHPRDFRRKPVVSVPRHGPAHNCHPHEFAIQDRHTDAKLGPRHRPVMPVELCYESVRFPKGDRNQLEGLI